MPALNYKIDLYGTWTKSDSGSLSVTESVVHNPWALATGTTDTEISMGPVTTASVLYITSDQNVSINLNANTGTDITVSANKPMLLTGSAITALYISNASGSTANIYIFIGGV